MRCTMAVTKLKVLCLNCRNPALTIQIIRVFSHCQQNILGHVSQVIDQIPFPVSIT